MNLYSLVAATRADTRGARAAHSWGRQALTAAAVCSRDAGVAGHQAVPMRVGTRTCRRRRWSSRPRRGRRFRLARAFGGRRRWSSRWALWGPGRRALRCSHRETPRSQHTVRQRALKHRLSACSRRDSLSASPRTGRSRRMFHGLGSNLKIPRPFHSTPGPAQPRRPRCTVSAPARAGTTDCCGACRERVGKPRTPVQGRTRAWCRAVRCCRGTPSRGG